MELTKLRDFSHKIKEGYNRLDSYMSEKITKHPIASRAMIIGVPLLAGTIHYCLENVMTAAAQGDLHEDGIIQIIMDGLEAEDVQVYGYNNEAGELEIMEAGFQQNPDGLDVVLRDYQNDDYGSYHIIAGEQGYSVTDQQLSEQSFRVLDTTVEADQANKIAELEKQSSDIYLPIIITHIVAGVIGFLVGTAREKKYG